MSFNKQTSHTCALEWLTHTHTYTFFLSNRKEYAATKTTRSLSNATPAAQSASAEGIHYAAPTAARTFQTFKQKK